VLRLHVLYGYNDKADKPDFFRKAYEPLNAEKTTKLDDIRKRYPTFIDDVPPAINLLLSHDSNGIYHLCNKEALTHYQFGLKVAKEFQLRAELLERGRIEDKKICERPLDNHLDCTKIERLGFKASTVDEALKKIHKQMQK
jgi:dTDP-4-dehydrorhamnose reductase